MRVPTSQAVAELEVKRSRFIAYADPFEEADRVKQYVETLRAEHPGCSHVVHAFLTGREGERFGMNDDHEPHGTAGRPILEVVRGSGLTNVLVRVVRYFGGTKLGTGGLARAYSEAARLVLAKAQSEELIERVEFRLSLEYRWYDQFLIVVEECGAYVTDTDFGTDVTISGVVPLDAKDRLDAAIADLTGGTASVVYPRE